MCAKVVKKVSQTWDALIHHQDLEKVAQQLCIAETKATQMKNEMKKFPLIEKIAKAVDMKMLQQQVATLQNQKLRTDKVTELQDEVERVIGIIQHVH